MIALIPAKDTEPAFCFKDANARLIPITYPKFQSYLRKLISRTGRNGSAFSSHSLCRSGCNFAFKSGVPSELIQSHGDWLSDAYKEYLCFDFQQKLSVCKQMYVLQHSSKFVIICVYYFIFSQETSFGYSSFRLNG